MTNTYTTKRTTRASTKGERAILGGMGTLILAGAALAYGTGAAVTLRKPAAPAIAAPAPHLITGNTSQPGVLLGRPKGELNAYAAARVEPTLMSVVFASEVTAWDYYHEAVGNGERVCLADLGAQHAKANRGQRYWLRTC